MQPWAYYNEIDKQKCAVLRELIREKVIAPGEVDDRSIKEVKASDLVGFTQCHFFAGIGIWSYAARLAGWPDDRELWTGSCPCPSFSCAGKGEGFDDPRHLWPDWARLIGELRPAVILGEQADDAIGFGWLDLVQVDMEAQDYAFGKTVLGACSVGAPEIRQRIYFVASSERNRWGEERPDRERGNAGDGAEGMPAGLTSGCPIGVVASAEQRTPQSEGLEMGNSAEAMRREACQRERFRNESGNGSISGIMDSTIRERLEGYTGDGDDGDESGWFGARSSGSTPAAGPVRGFWADAEWIPCRVPEVPGAVEWRPIKPGTFCLAHGAAARVLSLRCFGDGIVAPLAQEFIETVMEVID